MLIFETGCRIVELTVLHKSDKLDQDPHQFADDKPKCIEKYELI
jgi:hypothetical protein